MMLRRKKKEKGAALLTVLVAMMIISIMLFEFQYSSMVERKLAYNDLHQLQAYYLAKAGARMGLLRIDLFGRAKKMGSFAGVPAATLDPLLEMIWSMPLPPFPPDSSKVKELLKDDKDNAETILKQTAITDGKYSQVITSEGSKINLNSLVVPQAMLGNRIDFVGTPTTTAQYVGRLLITLIEGFLEKSEDPIAEYGNLRPEELVMDIMDWVNAGDARFMGGSKDAYYESLVPPYKAKRHKFYTLDELRMVRGMTDHLYNKLKPFVTVYSEDGKINLNTATETMYRALYNGFNDEDIRRIMEEKARRGVWASEGDFVRYVTSDLNRTGFRDWYPNPNDYPFGVGGRSFYVESLGEIVRSGSQIQKVIRIAVALTNPKGGARLSQYKTEAACNQAGKMWWREGFSCFEVPTTKEECEQGQALGSIWEQVSATQSCCRPLKNPAPTCPRTSGTGTGGTGAAAGSGTGAGATPATVPPADSMKILYWSET